jgi:hypothetical protein
MTATAWYDPALRQAVEAAVERLSGELSTAAPHLASLVARWTAGLAGGAPLSAYFTHDEAFPTLLLPWWVDLKVSAAPDPVFHADLAYSSINGYLYIRAVDNVMDGDDTIERQLLPAIAFFHSQFQFAYQRYFDSEHGFWRHFRTVWFHAAEAAAVDAGMTELDRERFFQVSALKVSAAKIPVAAVAHRHGRPDALAGWFDLIDRLGAFHQLLNDVFDWHHDLARGRATYLLSEGRRRADPGEGLESWMAREGFEWAAALLEEWLAGLDRLAVDLDSPELARYLQARRQLLADRRQVVARGLEQLRRLTLAWQPSRPDSDG